MIKRAAVFSAVIFAFSAMAGQTARSITPADGPAAGGTTVTITGEPSGRC